MTIIENLPFPEYQKIEALNQSRLKLFQRSPAHFAAAREVGSKSKGFGRAYDSFLLTPDWFAEEFFVVDKLPRSDSKAYEELQKKAGGKELLTASDFHRLVEMEKVLRATETANGLLFKTKRQLTLTWDEKGVSCKGRPDCYSPELKAIIDLKTTRDASPRTFQSDAFKYGYFYQADFYIRGARANGLEIEAYYILAQETERPYGVKVYLLGMQGLDKAHSDNEAMLDKYRTCVYTNSFPGYNDNVDILEMPAWGY